MMDFSPANFLLFFFCFCTSVLKKHTRAREETHYYAQKDTFLSLRNINTLRTNTEEKTFFFSLVFLLSRRFQRESFIYTPLSALKKKREREIALKIHLSEKREFEILNIRSSRARELRSHHHRHKREANKCRTRKKRPRRKR